MAEGLKYADAPARRDAILELLNTTGHLRTAEVAEHLGVSEMTARRDCEKLSDDGLAAKVRGGIRLAGVDDAVGFTDRQSVEVQAKIAVGAVAASLIDPADVVAIDAGTTPFQVARHLSPTFGGTVVTHSIPVIGELTAHPRCRVLSLGGEVFRPSMALIGGLAVDQAAQLDLSVLFLGAGAVSERGVFVAADVERGVKQALMRNAARVVVLIDHGKYERRAPVLLCGWDAVDTVICDTEPPTRLSKVLAMQGVRFVNATRSAN